MGNLKTEALQRAIDYLGAIEVCPEVTRPVPGHESYTVQIVAPAQYVVKHCGRWWTTTAANLKAIGATGFTLLKANGSFKMPAWWSPDRQTAYRVVNGDGSYSSERFSNEIEAWGRLAFGERLQRITCDLESGEEIPC